MPVALMRKSHVRFTERAKSLDRELLDRLEGVGFKLDFGEDGAGWQFKYLTRGGGYYFNVGCSDLIVEGKISLVQFCDIAGFVQEGARLHRGATITADLIVLATGYKGQEHLVRKLFGDKIADRVGPIWGFGDEEELRNMFMRTPQPGLWFIAGSFAQCRNLLEIPCNGNKGLRSRLAVLSLDCTSRRNEWLLKLTDPASPSASGRDPTEDT